MMRPMAYSGLSERKARARPNIKSGPMTQFWTSERARTRVLRNTSGSSSYFTLANGGYIIRMSPTAMGIEVVPTESRVMPRATSGKP